MLVSQSGRLRQPQKTVQLVLERIFIGFRLLSQKPGNARPVGRGEIVCFPVGTQYRIPAFPKGVMKNPEKDEAPEDEKIHQYDKSGLKLFLIQKREGPIPGSRRLQHILPGNPGRKQSPKKTDELPEKHEKRQPGRGVAQRGQDGHPVHIFSRLLYSYIAFRAVIQRRQRPFNQYDQDRGNPRRDLIAVVAA